MEQGSRYDLSAVHSQDTKARQEQWKKKPQHTEHNQEQESRTRRIVTGSEDM